MNKNLLTYISHNFCANCCGDAQKLNCDTQNKTCDKLASFLIGCNSYKEPIDEKKLYELAMDSMEDYKKDILRFRVPTFCQSYEDGYIAGYRKAWEDKQ